VLFSISSLAQNTSQWRGENRDGIYNETDLLKSWPASGPNLLWHNDELGMGHGSAVVYNGTIYTSGTEGENGFVIAFDASGKKLWKKEYGKEWMESFEGVRTTPAIVDGKLYIMSGYGLVVCMDAESGDIIWKVDFLKDYDGQNIQWGVTENLLIYDDIVICTPGGFDANVIALDRHSGSLVWKCKGKGEKSAYCSPQLINHNNRRIVVTQTASSILGIDAQNGTLLWSHDQPNKWFVHANTPLYHSGQLYCVSGYGKGGVMLELSADGTSVKELWRDVNLDSRMGGVVQIDGKIYGSGDSRKWVCLDWNTGKEVYFSKELKKGNIIAAEGLLYWYTDGGDIALVEPMDDKFSIISLFEVPYGTNQHWAHLVIDGKRLFVRHGSSLMVYSLAK
jgi:outer membrane protein assembly factor BamB